MGIKIYKEGKQTVFDGSHTIILKRYNGESCIWIDKMVKNITVQHFHIRGLGKWRWRIIKWFLKKHWWEKYK